MHFDPNITILIAVSCGIGYLMIVAGLQKSALELKRRRGADSGEITRDLVTIGAVAVTLFSVRVTFLNLSAYAIRLLDRRPQQRLRRVGTNAHRTLAVNRR